jgi:acetoin utilization deacetylase AcuC-like enzyme
MKQSETVVKKSVKPSVGKRKRDEDTSNSDAKRRKRSPETDSKLKNGKTVFIDPTLVKHELVCVINRSHKQQVDDKIHTRQVNDENSGFPHVRRNKKIQKVLELPQRKIVLCNKESIQSIPKKYHNEGVYDNRFLRMIESPDQFAVQAKPNEDFRWTLTSTTAVKEGEKPVVLSTDFSVDDLADMTIELEKDIGIIKHAVEHVLDDTKPDVAPLTTHPGHHAGPKKIANYCVLNNGIIAASMIKKNRPSCKIGLLDIDAHPGDGTMNFVRKNPHLLDCYVSLHTDVEFSNMQTFKCPEYAVVMKSGENHVGRPRQISWVEYDEKLQSILQSFQPMNLNVLIVCVGFDTLKNDPIAGDQIGYQLQPIHFRKIGLLLGEQDYQVFFIQEGGYDPNLTADAFDHLMKGFYLGRQAKAIKGL